VRACVSIRSLVRTDETRKRKIYQRGEEHGADYERGIGRRDARHVVARRSINGRREWITKTPAVPYGKSPGCPVFSPPPPPPPPLPSSSSALPRVALAFVAPHEFAQRQRERERENQSHRCGRFVLPLPRCDENEREREREERSMAGGCTWRKRCCT